MRSELDQLEKFIQYCHSKHEGLSDYYITQTYNNMQELLLVQFLNQELQHQQSKVDELQLKISEDSRILHNVIDIERKKNDELQKQIAELKEIVNASKKYD